MKTDMSQYVIRSESQPTLYYLGPDRWTNNPQQAYRFEFLTVAELYAMLELKLTPETYTVELVTARVTVH